MASAQTFCTNLRGNAHVTTCNLQVKKPGLYALSRWTRLQANGRHRPAVKVLAAQPESSNSSSKHLPELYPVDGSYADMHAFTSYANWIVPGAFMVGRYPYCEPSRLSDRQKAEEQLEKILRTGITTFVCLQGELPPQEEMALRGQGGFLPYKATAELIKSSLSAPPSQEVMMGLRNPTLDKFLPPKKRRSADPVREEQLSKPSYELQFVHFPIDDLCVPSSAHALRALVQDLVDRVARGEKLYVHCWGGRGRAGLVAACFLNLAYGMGAEEALLRVQKGFDTRLDSKLRSPETDEQHEFVRAFAQQTSKK